MTGLNRINVFSRFPRAGKAKTRLIPSMGAEAAAQLQRDMSGRTLLCARVAALQHAADLVVHYNGGSETDMQHWLGRGTRYETVTSADLGESMLASFRLAATEGCQQTLTIGSDCPSMSPNILSDAFAALEENDVVLGPASDGGYVLIGMKTPHPALFDGPAWGESTVLAQTREIAAGLGLRVHELPEQDDVDEEADLENWYALRAPQDKLDLKQITVIIPTRNEADRIEERVAALSSVAHEVIVVDGCSDDDTAAVARAAGAHVICAAGSRAQLLNAGAWAASGDVLLFLHADTDVPSTFPGDIADVLLKPRTIAGAFRFAIADSAPKYRLVTSVTNLRARLLQLPYGDQGLFLTRSQFHELGGFADMPIMEDYELVLRLRKHGSVTLANAAASTSARRWKTLGLLRTMAINQRMLWHFHRGVPPAQLASLYARDEGIPITPIDQR
jgi:rSAM/selenodomain-associated transferase 2/rSAM/selenodomain-associated transferase 1